MMRGEVDITVPSSHESTTFLFTSESVGEGHPGKQIYVQSHRRFLLGFEIGQHVITAVHSFIHFYFVQIPIKLTQCTT